ncbi:hypothetical protein SO802_022392 [Lithocarpus litseifolius]|uniref:Caffeic acid O-methyltransferase n=1 Tax=Lithocarpus litseifolius TaxID=425828 RepID=A0AAW2CIS4_9ROSI
MQLTTFIVLPMVLQSANELGVFDILAKVGPEARLSPSQIVAHLPTKKPNAATMIDRILRMLACLSVLGCSVVADDFGSFQRLYSLSPVSKHFVRNEDGVSLGPLLALCQDKSQLKVAILEGGIPFNRVYGMHAFEYPDLDLRFNKVLNTAMFNHTTIVMKKILESYKGFEQLTQLVDIGGGLGVTLNLIISRYSNIKGINFDLPHVIQHAPAHPEVLICVICVEHIGGDTFESVSKGHAIIIKVIVVEAVLPTVPENSSSMKSTSHLDLIMMTQNPGGKERSQQEFMALATRAGFSGIRFDCCVSDIWVMEFFK